MRSPSIAVTLALLAAVTLLVRAAYKPLAPAKESGMFVDGTGSPDTISGMTAEADAVVLVTYPGHRRTLRGERSGIPSTVYGFEIREVLKSHPALRPNRRLFELHLLGGIEEEPTFVRRTFVFGRRDLTPGHRYVIFARHHWTGWIPATGQNGGSTSIYDISGDRALNLSTEEWDNTSPPSSSALLAELRGR